MLTMSGNVTKKRGLKIKEVSRSSEYSGIDQNPLTHTRFVVRFNEGKNLLASDVLTGKSDPICFVWFGPSAEPPDPDDAGEGSGCRILRTKVCKTTLDPIWNDELVFPLDASEMSSWSDMKCVIYVRDEDDDGKDPEIKTYDELGMVVIPFADFIARGKALRESIVRSAEWYTLQLTPKTKQNPSGMRVVDGSIKLTVSLVLGAADVEAIRTQVRDSAPLDAGSAPIGQRPPSLAQQVQTIIRGVPKRPSTASADRRRPSSASSARSSSRSDSAIRVVAPMAPRPSTAKPQKSSGLSLDSPLATDALREETNEDGWEDSIAVVDEAEAPNNDATRSEQTAADLTAWKRDIRVQVDDRDLTDLLGLDPEGGDQCGLIEELVKIGLNAVKDNVAEYVKDNIADFVRDNVADRAADAMGRMDFSMLNAALLTGTKVAGLIKSRSEELAKELSADGDIVSAVNEAVKEKLSQLGSGLHLFKPGSTSRPSLDQGEPSADGAVGTDLDQEEPGMMLFGDQNANTTPDNDVVDDQLSKEEEEVAGKPTDSADSKGSAPGMVTAATTDASSLQVSSTHTTRNPAATRNATSESAVAAAGNAMNVVRALKEMSIDRRRLEQTVQRIASAAEAGFTKLSERLSRIEDSLSAKTTPGDGRSALDGGPPIGEEEEKSNEGGSTPKQGSRDARYSAVGSKRSRLNATAPANLEAKAVSKKANRGVLLSGEDKTASGSSRQRFGSTTAIADAKQRYAETRRRPIQQQESTANAGDDATVPSSLAALKESSFDSTKQKQQQKHGMELVYKGVDGKIASSAVAVLEEDPYYVIGGGSPVGLLKADRQSDQQHDSTSWNYHPDKSSPVAAAAGEGFHSDRLAEPMSSVHRYGMPPASSPPGQRFHLNREFSEVLERGSLEDVARLIDSTAPQPEALSALVRNRLFDAIATLLLRNSNRSHTERCLLWVLALVRGQPGLVEEVAGHTRRDLKDALERVASEPSKRGLLASLLKTQIVSQQMMAHR